MKSILTFDHYDVVETVYKQDPFAVVDSEEIIPSFKLKIKYKNNEKDEAILLLTIKLGDKNLQEYSVYLEATILGKFTVELENIDQRQEQQKEDFIKDLYRKNALAILFPYLRALVSDLTSKGSQPAIMLPPINIHSMLEKGALYEEYSDVET